MPYAIWLVCSLGAWALWHGSDYAWRLYRCLNHWHNVGHYSWFAGLGWKHCY